MCGIFGVVQNKCVQVDDLSRISDILSHRGPDDMGIVLINETKRLTLQYTKNDGNIFATGIENFNAALLHRRLSIIDLSNAAHQPMSYKSGVLWITFNGEIYNYLEIREQLQDKGYKFSTHSDTEVILAAYSEWGRDCVQRFNGIWAFAIYDMEKGQFFLSRDRLGVKPLFYYCKNGLFLFASEIKAIRSYLSGQLSLNVSKIQQYLDVGQIFLGKNSQTFFHDVVQLEPANNLIYQNGKFNTSQYWELSTRTNTNSFEKNVSIFRELFYNAIRLQFRSDVEVGSCLSGGLDSSSIVTVASNLFETRLHTFSAIWPGNKIDESFFINEVNKHNDCRAVAFEPNLDHLNKTIDEIIWHQEIPLSGASLIAQWKVFERVNSAGVKVVLDGEGSDEILAGYGKYLITYLIEMIESARYAVLYRNYENLKFAGYNLKSFFSLIKNRRTILSGKLKFADIPYKYSSLSSFLKEDLTIYSLPTLLHDKDRSSMAHSVEARVPFLDHELVEFTMSIPSEQKLNGGVSKIVLRESLKDILPSVIYNRKDKIGFATPIEERLFAKENGAINQKKFRNDAEFLSEILDLSHYDLDTAFGYRKNFCLYTLRRFIEIWG